MSQQSITIQTAVVGIVIAAATNNLVKAGITAAIGRKSLALLVAGPMLLSLVAGLGVAWLQ